MDGWAWWHSSLGRRRGTKLMCNWGEDSSLLFHPLGPWALDKVKKALYAVKRHFTAIANDSWGRHVHVGNCNEGYLLRTLKSFAIPIISFERQFRSLNTFDRINARYVRPVSEILPTNDECLGMNNWRYSHAALSSRLFRISTTTIISRQPTISSLFWIQVSARLNSVDTQAPLIKTPLPIGPIYRPIWLFQITPPATQL